jgi:hypothetical protein
MTYLELAVGQIAVLDTAEMNTWASERPVSNAVIFNSDTGSFWYWDGDAGELVELGAPAIKYIDIDAPSSGNTFTIPALVDATIKRVFRNGIGIRINPTQADGFVMLDSTTGQLKLGTNDAFYGEWLSIEYFGPNTYTPV